jgi:hypothetical protein
MKFNQRKIFIGATLIVALASGHMLSYSRSQRSVLDNSDQFTLYSLLPHPPEKDVRIHGLFHRNGILGQTQVRDPKLKAQIINALYGGFSNSISSSNNEISCFNPRHGIRAIGNGRTVDVEICFECGAAYFYENGTSSKQSISHEPQKIFDQALVTFHLPFARRPLNR